MLVKYWKFFKWFLFVPLILFVFFFNFKKVSAYVYKDSVYSSYTVTGQQNATLSNGAYNDIKYDLNNYQFNLDYDLLAFKFGNYKITTYDGISMVGTVGINQYNCSYAQTGSYYYCSIDNSHNGYLTTPDGYLVSNNGLNQGTLYMSANLHYLIDNVDYYVPCSLDTGIDYIWYCPFNKSYGQPKSFDFQIRNGGFESLTYNISLNGFKYYYNYDITEITIEQQQTNTNLQYIYQYQQDDSTTGATTQVSGDFTQLAQDFNTQLSGVNDLTQLVLLPISLFMDLSTDNCQPLHLQIPYVNMSVDLPCMKAVFNQYFNGLYSIFTTIMSAVICYWVAIKTGALVKEIVDCDNDRIEVVDL